VPEIISDAHGSGSVRHKEELDLQNGVDQPVAETELLTEGLDQRTQT
jgi:hypothetical protein